MSFFERIAFYLLLATIPIQLGKHFWPDFAFVQGIRVDYLSPTLYISDVAFILLFLASISSIWKKLLFVVKRPLFITLAIALLISSFLAFQPLAAFFGVIKFFEFFYIGFFVSQKLERQNFETALFFLILGGMVQVAISIMQFVSQSSIGGVFYFLGERTFSASTPDIALFHWGDQLLLRPYGTFPHPNVLGFYLLVVFVLLLISPQKGGKYFIFLKIVILAVLIVGIILTFSRIVIALLLFSLVVSFAMRFLKIKRKALPLAITSVVLLPLLIILAIRLLEQNVVRDVMLRLELLKLSAFIFQKSPIFGIGLNNFFYHEVTFQKTLTPVFLQPVHNIFVLWVVQTGMIGAGILIVFLKKLLSFAKKPLYKVLIVIVLIVGLFDHYLITLQQGQLMLSLLVGFVFSRPKDWV